MAKNRWKTPEFIAYFFIVGSVIIFTIPILLRMSSGNEFVDLLVKLDQI